MTTLEAKAKQKLYLKQLVINKKYAKLIEDTNKDITNKHSKALQKAEKQVKQRLINQERKIKNKQKEKENKVREKQWKPLLKVKPPKPKKVNHMKFADFYFSRCIRSTGAWQWDDWEWYNYDYTWNWPYRIKDLTCWHYETRGIYSTRYHVWNCLPQTAGQNKAEHHNPKLKKLFRERLVAKHWEHVVQEVEELARARTKNENAKTDMKYEHEYRKTRYEERYKHMRE